MANLPSITRRAAVIGVLASTTALAVPAVAGAAHPDAALLALGAELDARWAEEKLHDNGDINLWEAAYDRCQDTVAMIEDTPATTLDGLKVKARAVAWCHSGDEKVDLIVDQDTRDLRLANQIINKLLAL